MADDGMQSSPGQAQKRRRIQMGPQECLDYSNTPQGAASLTNPQSHRPQMCQASTSGLGQRGRTNGSCFIPGTRTESSGRSPLTTSSQHKRQYVSPSKGANAQPSQGNVYNSSGYALIGSLKRKSMQFPEAKVNEPHSCTSVSLPVAMVTNTFKKCSNPRSIEGLPTLSSATHSLDIPSDSSPVVDLPNSLPGLSSGNRIPNAQSKDKDTRFDHCALKLHSTSPWLPAENLPNERVFPRSGSHNSPSDRKDMHRVNQFRKSSSRDVTTTSEAGTSRELTTQAIGSSSRSSANSQAINQQSPLKVKLPNGHYVTIPTAQESEPKPQWQASTNSSTIVQLCGNQFKKSGAPSKSVTSNSSGERNLANGTQLLYPSQSLGKSPKQNLNFPASSKFNPAIQVPASPSLSSGVCFASLAGTSSGEDSSSNNGNGFHGPTTPSKGGILAQEIPRIDDHRSPANIQAQNRHSNGKSKSSEAGYIVTPITMESEAVAVSEWAPSTNIATNIPLCANQVRKSNTTNVTILPETPSSREVTPQGSDNRPSANSQAFDQQSFIKLTLPSGDYMSTNKSEATTASTSSPTKVQLSGYQFKKSGTTGKSLTSQCRREEIPVTKTTQSTASSQSSANSWQCANSSTPPNFKPAQVPKSAFSSGNSCTSSAGKFSADDNSSRFQKYVRPQSCPAKATFHLKQRPLTFYFGKKSPPESVDSPETSAGKVAFQKTSARKSLNKVWCNETNNTDLTNKEKSKACSHGPSKSPLVSAVNDCSKKHHGNPQQERHVSVPPSFGVASLADSLDAFENEDTFDDLDITDEGTVIHSQSSQEESMGAENLSESRGTSKECRQQADKNSECSSNNNVSCSAYHGVKSCPESVTTPETSPVKRAFPKQSVRKSLNEVWGDNKPHLAASMDVSSKKHNDGKQQESHVPVPLSSGEARLADSLEAFEKEDTFDDLEITDEGTVIHSQSSQEESMDADNLSGSRGTSKECRQQADKDSKCSSLLNDNVSCSGYSGVKSCPESVTTPETSPVKRVFPKQSVRKSPSEVWGDNKPHLAASMDVSSKKHNDGKQQESHVPVPLSSGEARLADSLEAFEKEDTFDDLEITDEGTVVHSQPSQEKHTDVEDSSASGGTSKECGRQVDGNSGSLSNDDHFNDSDDDGAWIEDMIERDDQAAAPLKSRTYGLVGDGEDKEEEEVDKDQDHFAKMPPEIMEDIFCRISVIDLLRNCSLVCRRWHSIISNESFMKWKKSYMKCKSEEGQWQSPLATSTEESCLLDVIRYLASIKRTPGESTLADLEKHSRYTFAKDLIAENLPELITNERPHPWSVVAAIVILAETVSDVKEVLTCLLHPGSTNGTTTVTEVLYCVATLLLFLQRKHNLCRRLHFRVFYALFLFENDARPSSIQVADSTPEVQWRKAKVGYNNKVRVVNQPPNFAVKWSHDSLQLCKVNNDPYNRFGRNVKYPLTQEQLRVVNHRLRGRQNEVVKVIAFAGTGKTTTLIKFAEANRYSHLLYVAFNKTVQLEASRTFPGNTECRTTHSLAFQKLKHRYGKKVTFALKPYIIRDLLPEKSRSEKSKLHWAVYGRLVAESVSCFMSSADEFITTRHVPESYTTASKPRTMLIHDDRMAILRDAEYLWERMIDENDKRAKITHDGYLKVYQLSKPIISDVDCLLIDEAQDLTAAQEDILLNQPIPKILVGDPHQQIYTFRGARNSMNNIPADTVYYLTQSFRFGSEIAYMANCILDVLKGMTDQTVIGKQEEGSLCGQQIGQKAIICRSNITIFKEAVRLTSMENSSHRRIGFTGDLKFEKLMELYKMSTGSCNTITDDFFRKMQTFHNLEVYARNADDVELLGMISIVKMYCHRLPELIEKILGETVNNLQYATIVLTTAHKAKGLEFDTVQLADDFGIFSPSFTQVDGEVMITESINLPEDEKNLIYVAVTRAKKSLLLNENLKKCLGKTSDHFKFPMSTKLYLAEEHANNQCLDCGQRITELERVTMAKVWAVKTAKVGGSLYHPHPTTNGGYICSRCAYHHLPGFQKIFLGDRKLPTPAQIE